MFGQPGRIATHLTALLALTMAATAPAQVGPTQPNAPPSAAGQAGTATLAAPAALGPSSWLHVGSDMPPDPAWRTGTLANGVRFAVRRNAVPASSLSIRVRIDAGGLNGDDAQAGWGHIIEHMTFRGTAHYGDGEGTRIWQRLGASFGIDTNAFTSPRATTYVLDLPRADEASYRLAMDVVSEMVQSATIDPAALAVEKQVVLAERAARFTPLGTKLDDAQRVETYAGTKMGRYPMIGTSGTIAAADAASLKAWYKRWYRPERAVVVVVGNADPALLEAVVREKFGGWRGAGARPAEPDYGSPRAPARPVAVVADPQAPNAGALLWVSPHDEGPWTIARQQRENVDFVALGVLRQRLASAVNEGGALVSTSASRSLQRHIADQLSINFVARGGQTRAALNQLFAILNDLRSTPPSQGEVDQQAINLLGGLRQQIDVAQTARSAAFANSFVNDVDSGDVSPTPAFYLTLFAAQKPGVTPQAVSRALAAMIAPDPRLIQLTSTGADAGGLATNLAAAQHVAAGHQAAVRAVSMNELPALSAPGAIAERSTIADFGIDRVRFVNGVTLSFKKTAFEKDTIRLRVVVGHGLLGRRPNDPGLFWTAGALGQAGFGPFTRDEYVKLASGRRIGFGVGAALGGVQLGASPGQRDLPDALRLMVAALTRMRFAEGPIARVRDEAAATYQTLYGSPATVLSAFGRPALYGGDTRFRGTPGERAIAALTLADFQRFWTAELARGPIRIEVAGDLDPGQLVDAVARTFGALPPRADETPAAASLAVTASPPPGGASVLRHRGDPDQAMVARVYRTPGVFADLPLYRTLGLAAAVVEARLVEEFREKDGGTYSPSVSRGSAVALPDYGNVVAAAQVRVGRVADFGAALDRITADLARNGPSADQLARAKATQVAAIERERSGSNAYWLQAIDDAAADPREYDSVRTAITGRQSITAEEVRVAAARYLTPGNSFSLTALPTAPVPAPARPAAARRR